MTGGVELGRLIDSVQRDNLHKHVDLPEEYFYASLPLCVIDAVFSIGVNYESVRNTVGRWCAYFGWPRLKSAIHYNEHTISDFLEETQNITVDQMAEILKNRQRTSSRSGILKSDAVRQFAAILQEHKVEKFGDTENDSLNDIIETEIRKIKGQLSGISFTYFLMLAGSDQYVKPDRMICRYLSRALDARIQPLAAKTLLVQAAKELARRDPKISPRSLDYAIWSFERRYSLAVRVRGSVAVAR